MKKDKIIEYASALVICIITFFNLFLPDAQIQKTLLTLFFLIYTIVIVKIVKFKKVDNINKNKIIILIIGLSIVYIFLLYLIGIYVGFYKNSNSLNKTNFYNTILPYIIIVFCSEIIRQVFITKNNKKNTLFITIGLIIAEITMNLSTYDIRDLDEMLIIIGYISFPAISINIFCNYIVKRYGLIPNVLYRMITTLYVYIFWILPDIYMFFQSIYRIIYPYIVYVIVEEFFEKNRFRKISRSKKIDIVSLILCIIIVISIVMLISCKFKYGILVVGSSSMTGTIDKGDAVVFERYDKQELEDGQIIVFVKDNVKTIYSIESIVVKNNETIYYTKGTNNQQRDEGYRTDKDIIGVVKFKIIDIGWPTIWLNDLFTK